MHIAFAESKQLLPLAWSDRDEARAQSRQTPLDRNERATPCPSEVALEDRAVVRVQDRADTGRSTSDAADGSRLGEVRNM